MTIRKHRRAISRRVHVMTPVEALRLAWAYFKRGKNAPTWIAFRVF